jgi:UDP-GlcNAc:undecaprenyl-phosphate GlcNAc-1-phosphate transferase
MGLAYDAYNTKPLLKSTVQLTCATILIVTGTYIKIFHSIELNCLLSLFWIVGMMNSINMLDNMDAITASVSKGIMICVIGFLVLDGDFKNEYFIILIGMLGSLVGFMYFNWNPSKMYMGDTGSQFLGVFLAAIGIQYFWNAPDNTLLGTPESVMFIKRLLIPLTAFILPITDTITVVINRLMKKQSPFIGGKDHTTHALARLGLNDRQVALVFITLSITSSAMALLIYSIENWKPFYTIVFTAYILIVFFALNYPTNRKIKTA